MKHQCPNCTSPVEGHPENGCVLDALIGVLRDRGGSTEAKLQRLHAAANVNALWDDVGRIIDALGDGGYGGGEPRPIPRRIAVTLP